MKPEATEVFAKELALIKNETVYQFVALALSHHTPDYFWTIPASVKGHHPPICRLPGGLVQHVKLAVTFADTFLDEGGGEYHGEQDDQEGQAHPWEPGGQAERLGERPHHLEGKPGAAHIDEEDLPE